MINPNGDILLYYVRKVALPAVLTYGHQVAAEHHSLCDCVCDDVMCHLQIIQCIHVVHSKYLNATFCEFIIMFLTRSGHWGRLMSIPAVSKVHPQTVTVRMQRHTHT